MHGRQLAALAAGAAIAAAVGEVRVIDGAWFTGHLGRGGAYDWGRAAAGALIMLLGAGLAAAVYVLITPAPGSAGRS